MTSKQLKKLCDELGIMLFDKESDTGKGLTEIQGFNEFIKKHKGVAIRTSDLRLALYDPNLTGVEKVHVIAHEIGHHVLGHLEGNDSGLVRSEAAELQADIFASVFLAMAVFTKGGGIDA